MALGGSDSLSGFYSWYGRCKVFCRYSYDSDGYDVGDHQPGSFSKDIPSDLRLNESVKEYEAGEKPEIYIGGTLEIRHLGNSIQNSYGKNRFIDEGDCKRTR